MKKLLLITLIISSILCFGCSKNNDDSDIMVKLNKVDISSLSNPKIKNIINDTCLEEGVYQIKTKSNTYIYFLGIENEFTDITCNVEDNTLNIVASLNKKDSSDDSNKLSQRLFVIYQKNTTISDEKTDYYDTINLIVNDKDTNFEGIIVL